MGGANAGNFTFERIAFNGWSKSCAVENIVYSLHILASIAVCCGA